MKIKLIIFILLAASFFISAEKKTEITPPADTQASIKAQDNSSVINFFSNTAFACVIGLGIAAFGCAIAQGIAISKAAEGVSRQPDATGKIQTLLLIGLAFIESVVIYVLVVVLILLYANPFIQYIVK
jgi:F-type H+-transporting ATPase subunit c